MSMEFWYKNAIEKQKLIDSIKLFCEEVERQSNILIVDMDENDMQDMCDEYAEDYAKAEAASEIASQILQKIEQFTHSGKIEGK